MHQVLYKNKHEAQVHLPHGKIFTLYDSSGRIFEFVAWFFSSSTLSLPDYSSALAHEGEKTCTNLKIA